jgi:hypothetical protein
MHGLDNQAQARQWPDRVIADRGYDFDPQRGRRQGRDIALTAPYRKNKQQRRYEWTKTRPFQAPLNCGAN